MLTSTQSAMFFPIVLLSFLAVTPAVVHSDDLNKVQDILNQIVGHYYAGSEGENGLGPVVDPSQTEEADILIPQSVLRDEEHLPYNPLWGHQFLSGGAGEGKQYLNPEGTIPNPHQVKSDSILPAYCDPPNPCPEGFVFINLNNILQNLFQNLFKKSTLKNDRIEKKDHE